MVIVLQPVAGLDGAFQATKQLDVYVATPIGRAGQGRAGQGRAGQGRAGQGRAGLP